MTTKSHWSGDHSVEQQEALEGIGGMGEDCGERNHQDEAKADRCLGCVRHFPTRESVKSKKEVQRKDQKMQAKIVEIEGKRKRGHLEGTKARQAARKARRLEAREEILTSAPPVGGITALRELRLLALKEG